MDPEREQKPDKHSDHPSTTSSMAGAGAMAGLGLQFALSVLLFLWLGQWIDGKLGTEPIFLLLFVFLGAGASIYSIHRKLMAQQRREDEERKRK
jgi:F0F1-type ATP synthase assembly protein I